MANWANKGNVGDPLSPGWQEQNLDWIEPVKGQRWQVYKPARAAFEGLLTDLAKLGYTPTSDGGFNYRNIRGGDQLSQHAFGTAIDLNSLSNPMGQAATDIPQAAELAKKWGLEWGGNWNGRPDPMHFEFTGTGTADAPFTPGMTGAAADPQQAFVQQMWPYALAQSQRTGVDPRLIIAQAAQETGWGKSAPGQNYFGIKGSAANTGAPQQTLEYVNGKMTPTTANFRQYKSPEESFTDYGDFLLNNKRYEGYRTAKGLDAQAAALQATGYATDPNYGSSVLKIAQGIPEGGYPSTVRHPPNPTVGTSAPADPAAPAKKEEDPWWKRIGQGLAGATGDMAMPKSSVAAIPQQPSAAVASVTPRPMFDTNEADRQRQEMAMALARLNSGKLFVGGG